MKSFAAIALIFSLLASCAVAPFAAAAAIGVWSADQNTSEGGSIPVEANGETVWAAAKAVAMDRAGSLEPLEIVEASRRLTGRMNDCEVFIRVLPFKNTDKVYEIRVSAWQGLRGRADIAQQIAEDIAARI
jgi:hypothetical protein